MTTRMRGIALAATISFALVPAAFAQDAMAPAPDAMAPAADAMMAGEPTMPPISDEDFELCMKQAGGITFPAAMQAAAAACLVCMKAWMCWAPWRPWAWAPMP